MADTSNETKRPARRDISYYRQRQKNRVFTALAAFFAQEAERGNITKKELARRLDKDPAQITRWLTAPSNFTLDVLSDLLLAMGAEMNHEIVRFSDLPEAKVPPSLTGTDRQPEIRELCASVKHRQPLEIRKPVSGTDPAPAWLSFTSGA